VRLLDLKERSTSFSSSALTDRGYTQKRQHDRLKGQTINPTNTSQLEPLCPPVQSPSVSRHIYTRASRSLSVALHMLYTRQLEPQCSPVKRKNNKTQIPGSWSPSVPPVSLNVPPHKCTCQLVPQCPPVSLSVPTNPNASIIYSPARAPLSLGLPQCLISCWESLEVE